MKVNIFTPSSLLNANEHGDAVLTWIHIYLFSHTQSTSSAATSLRIYYEANKAQDWNDVGGSKFYNGKVPMGISIFPRELLVVPTA